MIAQELRIGNRLWFDKSKLVEVTAIGKTSLYYKEKDGSTGFWSIDAFEPVWMSKEVLLECGFLEENLHYTKTVHEPSGHFGDLYEWRIVLDFHGKNHDYKVSLFIKGLGHAGYLPNVDHLHSFQNLYYALTGKELEFSK